MLFSVLIYATVFHGKEFVGEFVICKWFNTLIVTIFYSFIITCFHVFTECHGEDSVDQPEKHIAEVEGKSVTLKYQIYLMCNYSTSSYNDAYIYWYKQLENKSPTFILSEFTVGKGTTEDEFKERFSATLNSTYRTGPLMIKNLRVSDSAVYYCALRPTVTEAHSTLTQKH
uniref:Ig-like domain-containing protein n=1 Tax=Cyprinus carpio TaxID=7962 RepID=A0A8C1Z5V1_CYPCA